MKYNIIFGGKAGSGPNILSDVVARSLIERGYFVFYSRDYQSLIRGGHNFNQLTFSDNPVFSNGSKIQVIVCLDDSSEKIHKNDMDKNALVLKFIPAKGNMFYAGQLAKILGLDFSFLEKELKELKNFEENIKEAREGFSSEKRSLKLEKPTNKDKNLVLMNGSQAMAISAVKSGLDFYYAYPMTPATPVMMELGQMMLDKKNKHKVIEVENEIAVALAGVGSSVAGKVAFVGTSGGGFDLMTETLSFIGIAEVPLVFYLSQRPGPGTGVATYTSQGDLNMVLHSGHGEFFRLVLAPGDNEEVVKLTNDAFYLANKYRIPAIVMMDKHLSEAKTMFNEKNVESQIKEIKSSVKVGERFNSYEKDSSLDNIATEDAQVIKANFDKRMKKQKEIEKETEKFERMKVYGNKNSKNLIIFWGSTKGAVLDAVNDNKIDAKILQVLYMEPFPAEELKKEIAKANKVILVENNSTAQLARLIAEKTSFQIEDKNKILRYDGRPFFSDELAEEIKRRMK